MKTKKVMVDEINEILKKIKVKSLNIFQCMKCYMDAREAKMICKDRKILNIMYSDWIWCKPNIFAIFAFPLS